MVKNIFLAFALLLPSSGASGPERVELDIDFCQLPLPNAIKLANASFYILATFQIGRDGKPTEIQVIKRDLSKHVDESAVVECVKGWTFAGIEPGTRVAARWYWKHGHGWESLSVTGSGISYRVRASGERCPYPVLKSGMPPVRTAA